MANGTGAGGRRVEVISRRVVHADPPPGPAAAPRTIHLTPWDLRMLSLDYIQKGVLLPKPDDHEAALVDCLASSFARALARFHPFAGRLAVDETAADTVTVSLRCTGEGAELVHAAAPGVAAADVAGVPYIPRDLVAALFPLNGLASADAASVDDATPRRGPLLAAQVTELADAVFVGVSLNHAVGDGTTFWHFVNTWSGLSWTGGEASEHTHPHPHPLPVLERWFLDTCPVPVPLPFARLEHAVRRYERRPELCECFFHFSAESVRRLKATANAEVRARSDEDMAATTISSLQALLAHLWRAVCRARRLVSSQETAYVLLIGCRGRVKGIPPAGYVGNAVVPCKGAGLGWAARQLNRAVASFDEAALLGDSVKRWVREPRLAYNTDMVTVSNDFGWGGNKLDGKTSVFEGRGGGGAMALEVCFAPDTLARILDDAEFMDAVTAP
ncbi:hypothetical protein BS78_K269700 [Paspalum vaginatum]|uniref:Acetyltransferase n=1 Tax=Paspalum vaginatum TaxID=158149 RepID=A0A9W7XE41_9POAL|nr:hypothetical protein BS78_K269700 [Paspalum vaginatum]